MASNNGKDKTLAELGRELDHLKKKLKLNREKNQDTICKKLYHDLN